MKKQNGLVVKNEEASSLTTKDFQDVGISANLSTNDLVEVVATELFNDITERVNGIKSRAEKLTDKDWSMFKDDFNEAIEVLVAFEHLTTKEAENVDQSVLTIGWQRVEVIQLHTEEVNTGTRISTKTRAIHLPPASPGKKVKVPLVLNVVTEPQTEKVSCKGISGTIETGKEKMFQKVIEVPYSKFETLRQEIAAFNKEVMIVFNSLPANKTLSVEKFTREARVKMNKKIISSQSPDFKKKMAEVFGIKM